MHATGALTLHDRALGAFLGFAIGDALGATVEFMTKGEIAALYGVHDRLTGGGWLKLAPGKVTDDTEMALALGRSLIRHRGLDPRDLCEEFAAENGPGRCRQYLPARHPPLSHRRQHRRTLFRGRRR